MLAKGNTLPKIVEESLLGVQEIIPLRQMSKNIKISIYALVITAALIILGILVWQGVTAQGNPPDPNNVASKALNPISVMINAGILVFREGLEAILVLAALTAGLTRANPQYWKPVAIGSSISFLATVITYFAMVAILVDLDANNSANALNIQAATGLVAVVVLMVIMNWFFHKIYWTGWISHHNKRQRDLTQTIGNTGRGIYWGLVTIGFTSVYREGFEVAIMLQSWRLRAHDHPGVVLAGVLIGLALTGLVALLTFAAHYRLPYRRMLILTGVMMGGVMLVMVGESAQEMQLAGWIPTHDFGAGLPNWLSWLNSGWMNTWFATFPNWEGILLQLGAAIFVAGTYFVSQYFRVWRPAKLAAIEARQEREVQHNTSVA
ncbi:MAG TPA: FTR1 family protein [Phycisphaerae bacterium]|nr:FTR1 family protein [Phycisphaerae bacterium]